MNEYYHGKKLANPENLGAPMPSTLAPRLSWRFEGFRGSMGRESARMIILSLIGGVFVFFALAFLGSLLNEFVW